MLVLLFSVAGKCTTRLTFVLKKKNMGAAFASLGEEAVFHSHTMLAQLPPACSAWMAVTSLLGLVCSLCTPKVPSSKPHQLPGGHGEDRSIRMRINP